MPEGVEIELYRRSAEAAIGRTITSVEADDAWYLKGGTTADEIVAAAVGAEIDAARRIGKLLVLDLSSGHRLGLRFGMTGRLIVDAVASIDHLEYSSRRDEPEWDRFVLHFADGGSLRCPRPAAARGRERRPRREFPGFRCLHDHAETARPAGVGGWRRGEGQVARSVADRRSRQPDRRRNPLASGDRSRSARRFADRRRGPSPPPVVAPSGEGVPGRRRFAHGAAHDGPNSGRALPALWDRTRPADHRRAHHVFVPEAPTGLDLTTRSVGSLTVPPVRWVIR